MVKEITYPELQKWTLSGKEFLLVDVREAYEHEAFNIGGRLIPLGELIQNPESIKQKNPVVLYCQKGIRSQIAIQRLQSRSGMPQMYNLKQGISHLK